MSPFFANFDAKLLSEVSTYNYSRYRNLGVVKWCKPLIQLSVRGLDGQTVSRVTTIQFYQLAVSSSS